MSAAAASLDMDSVIQGSHMYPTQDRIKLFMLSRVYKASHIEYAPRAVYI